MTTLVVVAGASRDDVEVVEGYILRASAAKYARSVVPAGGGGGRELCQGLCRGDLMTRMEIARERLAHDTLTTSAAVEARGRKRTIQKCRGKYLMSGKSRRSRDAHGISPRVRVRVIRREEGKGEEKRAIGRVLRASLTRSAHSRIINIFLFTLA